MEIILQSDYPSLGYVGDRLNVTNGYARNYLIPRGIAVEASSKSSRQIEHLLSAINKKKALLRAEAEALSKKFEAVSLDFKLKAGDGGKTFGAITSKDIEAALKEKGFEVSRRQVRLNEAIKKVGEYKIQLKLHSEVTSTLILRVALDGVLEKPADEEPKKARGKKGAKRGADDAEAVEGETSEAQAAESARQE